MLLISARRLLTRAWKQPTARRFLAHGIYNQPAWGYCGYGTINTILLSLLPDHTPSIDDDTTDMNTLQDQKQQGGLSSKTSTKRNTAHRNSVEPCLLRVPGSLSPLDGVVRRSSTFTVPCALLSWEVIFTLLYIPLLFFVCF